MIIQNPTYETWEKIEKKYKGYCVFMVNCKGQLINPEGGEVWGFNKSLADLSGEVDHFIESGEYELGEFVFKTLTGFGYTSMIHVVSLE